MTYLVAAIEHHARKLAHAVTRAVVEKCSGFSDYEAGDHLQHVHADMLADVEAEYEVGEPSNVDVHLTYMGCGLDMESYATGFNAGYEQAQEHIIADGPPVDMRDITVADRWCGPCGEVHAWRSQTPEAGQPGENPAGVTPQTPAGSPDPSRVTVGAVRGEGSPAEIATFPRRPAGERPTWVDWAVPAICDVLAVHVPFEHLDGKVTCVGNPAAPCPHFLEFADAQDWRDHVAPLIADRLGAAMESDALRSASETFPQFRTTPK